MIIDDDITFKFLPASILAELLSKLPEDYCVCPNRVGNMSIYQRDGDDFKFVGFIDFLFDGDIEIFDDNLE